MNKTQFLTGFINSGSIRYDSDYPLKTLGKPAAVLIPIIQHQDRLTVLFTLRAKHLKHHGGQISFPGGKQEPTDNSLVHTALRETEEEVGIDATRIKVIGNLPLYRTTSQFEVTPYIGFIEHPVDLRLDTNEVDSTFEVPLTYLLDPKNHLTHWVKRNNIQHPVYFIPWQQYNIWGATAAFVRNLSYHFS
ncbi:CoA pyrophosphatase [Paraglaciecola aquimarina]|uniref:CoA pyrophosphatase n=1 Tax=Paraglaciecola aquimarina TaxID=1235557 RepID=A0ABU3SXC6_9ALTE|nr:CoA pyrophosphatase [Paraglaciecola aquimarina]MDU0354664.1 CoA pyrophosphatase [Paraglaciecola aquimarina]